MVTQYRHPLMNSIVAMELVCFPFYFVFIIRVIYVIRAANNVYGRTKRHFYCMAVSNARY